MLPSFLNKDKRSGRELSAGALALVMNIPSGFLIIGVLVYPLGYAFWLSFHQVGIQELRTGDYNWVGFSNYAAVLADPAFMSSFINTVIFTAIVLPLEIVLAIAIALAANMKGIRLGKLTALLMIIPWAVPAVVNGVMWSFLFNSAFGYINTVLLKFGIVEDNVRFISDPYLAMGVVIVAYVWRTTPFAALIFHAALQNIPDELYEAATLDGASVWQRLWYITLPLIKPAILVVLVLRTLFAFTVFDEIFAITYGGPGDSTWVAAWYIYANAFVYFKLGVGNAAAFLLSIVIGALAILYMRMLFSKVEYG